MDNKLPKLIFKADKYYLDYETEDKGYRNDVFVEMPNGDIIEVFFYDSVRLSQDLGDGVYIAKPGLIVLKKVNKSLMNKAIVELYEKGFFDYFTPRASLTENHFEENI
jgi:hypothetical protein